MKASLMLSLTLLLMASATVTAAAQPPSGSNAAQSITEEADNRIRLSFIRSVQVVPRASFVDISYSTPQPAGALIEISTQRPLAAVVDLPDVIPAGQKAPPSFPPDVALTTFAISSDKVTTRTGHLRDLQPNTTYYYVITTVAPDGRTHRYWDKFTTINRVVKVVFERVLIVNKAFVGGNTWSFNFAADDSWLSDPDGWLLAYPGNSNSVPLGSSEWADVNVETTIQHASESLPLSVFAFAKIPFDGYRIEKTRDDPRPEGQNTGSTRNTAWATARDGIDLTANSTDQPGTYPFKLAATGSGSLMMFEVLGRVEISYPDIGRTSSARTTAPGPAPVKAQGRVTVPGAAPRPALPICEAAKLARARNSPAAPGLEEKCRAEGAVKAQGRVQLPEGTTPTKTLTKCEAAKLARARNSPAAPGLEAQCLAEQKP